MKPIKKIIYIITITLAGMALLSSCSKTEGPQKKGAKGPKTSVVAKEKAPSTSVQDKSKNSLNAIRHGQYVDLNWQFDTPVNKIQKITIMRSSVGVKQRRKAAELEPQTTHFRDTLPDGNAQWYWLGIVGADGKTSEVGPVRVDRDPAGLARYANPEDDKFNVVVIRTDNIATLTWDFPAADFRTITINRCTRPTPRPFPASSTLVTTSLECKVQYTDTLPDPNADYWYWFKLTTKSGAVIHKGPVKAEYN